jgi:transcriptional regulator with XRE-family HTH domain
MGGRIVPDWLSTPKHYVTFFSFKILSTLFLCSLCSSSNLITITGISIVLQRKHLKMSQDELAKKIGTSAPIVGRYERNEIKPSIEAAKKIADELGVTVDYLIGGSARMVVDKKMMKRMEDIEALPADDKDKVYYLIDTAITYNKTKKEYAK